MRKLKYASVLAVALIFAVAGTALAHWPVANRKSWVSQWSHRGHVAIDIAAPKGTRIFPVESGRVVYAGWRRNCGGWQVYIRHSNGTYAAYYHMLYRPRVVKGQYVTRQKTVIGYVGKSGLPPYGVRMTCATGYHLHLEVWRGYPWRSGSYRVNPWRYINHGYWLPYRYR